jgi:hypothetical protein
MYGAFVFQTSILHGSCNPDESIKVSCRANFEALDPETHSRTILCFSEVLAGSAGASNGLDTNYIYPWPSYFPHVIENLCLSYNWLMSHSMTW